METLNINRTRHLVKRALLHLGYHKTPDFLIIGAQKAGTTYLYSVLRQHPQIVEPVHKEAHFFDYDWNYKKGLFQYQLNFNLSFRFKENQKTFEATPDYLAHKYTPKRIANIFPKMKMIVILREPISRAYSAWKMHHYVFKNHKNNSWLHDPRQFETVVEEGINKESSNWDLMNHVGRSLYGMQIDNFMRYFPPKNFLILLQEDLSESPQKMIDKICDFIEVDKFDLNKVNKSDDRFWENKSNTRELEIKIPFENELHNFYKEDKELLKRLINKNLPW